jgi:hypothetical protein
LVFGGSVDPATWIQGVADASRETFSERIPSGFQEAPQQERRNHAGVAGRDFAGLDRTFLRFRITHGNHPRSNSVARIFQCLAVPQQPLVSLNQIDEDPSETGNIEVVGNTGNPSSEKP